MLFYGSVEVFVSQHEFILLLSIFDTMEIFKNASQVQRFLFHDRKMQIQLLAVVLIKQQEIVCLLGTLFSSGL